MGNNRTSLDWVEFTYHPVLVPGQSVIDAFCHVFPEFDEDMRYCGIMRERGTLNYACVCDMGCNAYSIMWHPDRPEMGVHVRFPGSAVPLLSGIFRLKSDNQGWSLAAPLFDILNSRVCEGARIRYTRIDIAFDDFDKVYTPADYIYFQFSNRIRSKCKQSQCNFSALQSPNMGSTWYLGKRSGSKNYRFLRVYDKNYQSKGKINSIRYELELRGDYAARVIDEICANSSTLLFGDLIQDMFVVLDELPFQGTSYKSIAEAKHRASVDQKFLSIFETQVSRRVRVLIPGHVSIDNFSRLSDYIYRQRRPIRFFLDTFGIYKLQAICDTYKYKPTDVDVLRKIRSEAFYEYNY